MCRCESPHCHSRQTSQARMRPSKPLSLANLFCYFKSVNNAPDVTTGLPSLSVKTFSTFRNRCEDDHAAMGGWKRRCTFCACCGFHQQRCMNPQCWVLPSSWCPFQTHVGAVILHNTWTKVDGDAVHTHVTVSALPCPRKVRIVLRLLSAP